MRLSEELTQELKELLYSVGTILNDITILENKDDDWDTVPHVLLDKHFVYHFIYKGVHLSKRFKSAKLFGEWLNSVNFPRIVIQYSVQFMDEAKEAKWALKKVNSGIKGTKYVIGSGIEDSKNKNEKHFDIIRFDDK